MDHDHLRDRTSTRCSPLILIDTFSLTPCERTSCFDNPRYLTSTTSSSGTLSTTQLAAEHTLKFNVPPTVAFPAFAATKGSWNVPRVSSNFPSAARAGFDARPGALALNLYGTGCVIPALGDDRDLNGTLGPHPPAATISAV